MTGYKLFDAALRLAVLLACLGLFVFIMAAGAAAAFAAANLKTDVTLTGDNLTVGDIFDNAGQNAAYVLGPAPAPGKEMVLNTATLLRIASALDLQWQPASNADQIVVRRAATIIPSNMVLDSIETALRDKVVDEKFTLDTGTMNLGMTLPHGQPATIDVTDVTYNPRTARFEATVSAPSAANPLKKATITGSVKPLIAIPVLKTALRSGDIIGASDVEMIDVYTADIQPDTILKAENLIGMTPRRMAAVGKPLRITEMQAPQMVARGENVTIVFKAGPLSLTAMGRAMQNGARGEIIHVVNNSSNRSVDAIVTGTREVVVKE